MLLRTLRLWLITEMVAEFERMIDLVPESRALVRAGPFLNTSWWPIAALAEKDRRVGNASYVVGTGH